MTATYLACLTPPGTGAIAVLGLRGPSAWELVRQLAQRDLPPWLQPGRFWLTRLGDGARGGAGDVVVAVKELVPQPWLELHCHGGQEVVHLLEDLLTARGAKVCAWQQFERALPSEPLRRAALAILTNAPTARTAGIALDQYNGAFSRATEAVAASLRRGDRAEADRLLAECERYAAVGQHLTTPWRVVIAGAPNVGKSSLVNALAGYQRAVVSSMPGTTRDVVTTVLALDGWPVDVADTAGWRAAETALEREGIARARQAAASADLCLWLLDASAPPVWPDVNLCAVEFVVNKTDLAPAWPHESIDAVRVSAQTGVGLPDLCQSIVRRLVPAEPPPGAAVPFTAKLAAILAEVRRLIQQERVPESLEKLENLQRECD
jgi:tRNA modification GTPase